MQKQEIQTHEISKQHSKIAHLANLDIVMAIHNLIDCIDNYAKNRKFKAVAQRYYQ